MRTMARSWQGRRVALCRMNGRAVGNVNVNGGGASRNGEGKKNPKRTKIKKE